MGKIRRRSTRSHSLSQSKQVKTRQPSQPKVSKPMANKVQPNSPNSTKAQRNKALGHVPTPTQSKPSSVSSPQAQKQLKQQHLQAQMNPHGHPAPGPGGGKDGKGGLKSKLFGSKKKPTTQPAQATGQQVSSSPLSQPSTPASSKPQHKPTYPLPPSNHTLNPTQAKPQQAHPQQANTTATSPRPPVPAGPTVPSRPAHHQASTTTAPPRPSAPSRPTVPPRPAHLQQANTTAASPRPPVPARPLAPARPARPPRLNHGGFQPGSIATQTDSTGASHKVHIQSMDNSCGPTSVAMVANQANGESKFTESMMRPLVSKNDTKGNTSLDPASNQYHKAKNYGTYSDGLAQTLREKPVGLSNAKTYDRYNDSNFEKRLREGCSYDKPGIALVEFGDGTGHYVVNKGLNKNGKLTILDPIYGLQEINPGTNYAPQGGRSGEFRLLITTK